MAIPIYWLNLRQRTDRRETMMAQFAALGLDAIRIEAVTPADLTEQDRRRSCNPRRHHWMTEAELACNLSHIKAWRSFLDTAASHALILEDDAELSADLPGFLAEIEHLALPAVLRIESICSDVRLGPPAWIIDDIAICRVLDWHAGAAGYIISRPAAAKLIVADELRERIIDSVITNPFSATGARLHLYCCDPALCRQSGGRSDLVAEREHRRVTDNRRPLVKFAYKVASWFSYDARLTISRWRHRIPARQVPFRR